jgi:hypothetical protein
MFYKLLQSFGFLFVLSCAAFAQNWTWKTFAPENGAWSILAPGEMKPDAEAQEANGKKGSYSYSDFNGFFAVVYQDTPKRVVPWGPNRGAYYRKVTKGFVKANRGEILKDEEYLNGASKGREVLIKIPVGATMTTEGQTIQKHRVQRLRMFFHDKRFYLLIAMLPENEISSPAVNQYFDSFVAK